VTHLTSAQKWAGGGAMVGAIAAATQREPVVVGKPSTFMLDHICNSFGISKAEICMVVRTSIRTSVLICCANC
jgi:ribonucleotide monophosphatase NagD (HAD superfamily)